MAHFYKKQIIKNMNDNLYKNKYRIPSARLQNWDYRSAAPYFVTICSKSRDHIFGEIKNKKIFLNELGKHAYQLFRDINIYTNYAKISNCVIKPDHVHAIIELTNRTKEHIPNKFGPLLKKSLSSVVNHYKGRVTRFANKHDFPAGWQERFHDHIIRDLTEYKIIFNYITNNPKKWEDDKFYKQLI